LGTRWREVDVLLNKAKDEESKPNLDLHDVLCRAAVVLIAAHLEGFVRDCAKAVVDDINHFSTFKKTPNIVKRTFCSSFIVAEGEESNARVEKLIQTFDTLETKLSPEPFLFHGKNDDQKNASPSVIERITRNFGVKKVFSLLAGSKLDDVFAGSALAADVIATELQNELSNAVLAFPYTVDVGKFGLDVRGTVAAKARTLWETFLDSLMKERHQIAHGSSQLNGSSVSEIRLIKAKVIVLQYGLMAVLCNAVQ
jgi:hypothetical protein